MDYRINDVVRKERTYIDKIAQQKEKVIKTNAPLHCANFVVIQLSVWRYVHLSQ